MKKITVNKTRILTAAAALVAVFSLAGCGSNAVQEIPRSAETSRSEEATPETAAPETTATPAPTPEPAPAVVVPTSVTLEQEGGILNNGMTWTLQHGGRRVHHLQPRCAGGRQVQLLRRHGAYV